MALYTNTKVINHENRRYLKLPQNLASLQPDKWYYISDMYIINTLQDIKQEAYMLTKLKQIINNIKKMNKAG